MPVSIHMFNGPQQPCHLFVQLAVSQITGIPPVDCNTSQRLAYKPGLWLVRGVVLPAQQRTDAHAALHFEPASQELCDCITHLVRSNITVVSDFEVTWFKCGV